jgi:hypothetical protein
MQQTDKQAAMDAAREWLEGLALKARLPYPRLDAPDLAALLTRHTQQAVEAAKPEIERAAKVETLEWVRARIVDRLHCIEKIREYTALSGILDSIPDALADTKAALERLSLDAKTVGQLGKPPSLDLLKTKVVPEEPGGGLS